MTIPGTSAASAGAAVHAMPPPPAETETAYAVEEGVLWLASAIVDQANRVRPNPGGTKSGATKRPTRRSSRS